MAASSPLAKAGEPNKIEAKQKMLEAVRMNLAGMSVLSLVALYKVSGYTNKTSKKARKLRQAWYSCNMGKFFRTALFILLLVLPAQADTTTSDYRKMLFGEAKKHSIQTEQEALDDNLFRIAAQKLSEGYKLSADEYRALGVGCAGYECHRQYFQKIAVVTRVYKDSPAEKAGIRVGDKMIDEIEDNEQARAHPNVRQIQIRLAQAGDPVEVTMLRDGQPVKISIIRMNIADIKESKIRQMWEKTVRNLGYPKEGVYTGTSLRNLAPQSPQK